MVAISSLTDGLLITILFLAAMVVFYRDAVQAIAKSLIVTGPFLLVMAIATVLYSRFVSGFYNNWEVVGSMSVRALLLAFLTFVFIRRVNLIEALAFSKSLSIILSVAMAQIFMYRRLAADFHLALRSRSARKPGVLSTLRGASTLTGSCLMLSIQHGRDVADALKSRGA
jgi:cobalt/nickel transport system permease protein